MRAVIRPFRAAGTVEVPSSKSELHRLLIAAALADRPSDIPCRDASDDVRATAACLRALGASVMFGPRGIRATPVASPVPDAVLDCGESGSTLRFLLPVAAALGGARLTGRGRLPERPLGDLLMAMAAHGARFSADRLPLDVAGPVSGGVFTLPGQVSSQYVTGLMLAAPLMGETGIRWTGRLQSADYVRMTAEVLARFGVRTEIDWSENGGVRIPGGQRYASPGEVPAGGDWSAAAFPLCLGALAGPVAVAGLRDDTSQGDRRIMALLRQAGADGASASSARRGALRAIRADVSDIPDMVPALAALAMHAEGTSVFLNAGRLRLKESDRLATTCAMVRALGGEAAVEGDALAVTGRTGCPGGTVDGAGDHRIVMAAAVGASACTGPSVILGAEAVSKSWPGFFDALRTIGGDVSVLDDR